MLEIYKPHSWNDKEWWFSYVFDRRTMLYFSWTFFRAIYSDCFAFFALDILRNHQWSFQKICRLENSNLSPGAIRLSKSGSSFSVLYEMGKERGRFRLSAGAYSADLVLVPSNVPPFSKIETQFTRQYHLEHRYKNVMSGVISLDGADYAVHSDHSYQDHCFGNVPRRTGWHWIALQNDTVSLTSLVNYGPFGQKYSQVYDGNQWARLDQGVTFEHDWANSSGQWRITSTDVDLILNVRGMVRKITRIPPLLPFLVRVDHTEFFVQAAGRIKIDGSWRAVRDLSGVMEEHHGWW